MEELDELWEKADAQELTENQLVVHQHKDKHGVCIIPPEQNDAATKLIELLGRKVTDVTGSRHGPLRYGFAPPLTEEEYDRWVCST